MSEIVALADVYGNARKEIRAAGSQSEWARQNGMSPQTVCDILNDRIKPTAKFLDALGLRRITIYQRVGQ